MKTLVLITITLVIAGILIYFFRQKASSRRADKPEFTEEEHARHYEAKTAAMERILGPMHGLVGHAIIPFQIGGAVDMYYFPKGIPGTGFATMELIEPDGSGPKPNRIGTYEFVAFTRHGIPSPDEKSEEHPLNKIDRRICGIFTALGHYSYEAVLNPGETSEIPGKEKEPNTCLIFDEYSPDGKSLVINGRKHGLLLVIEVFRSEMEHARKHGSAVVLAKLKEAGHYPYSDLDRKPVF